MPPILDDGISLFPFSSSSASSSTLDKAPNMSTAPTRGNREEVSWFHEAKSDSEAERLRIKDSLNLSLKKRLGTAM